VSAIERERDACLDGSGEGREGFGGENILSQDVAEGVGERHDDRIQALGHAQYCLERLFYRYHFLFYRLLQPLQSRRVMLTET
jgi:hypothetical protein